jgi:hypothetical protein
MASVIFSVILFSNQNHLCDMQISVKHIIYTFLDSDFSNLIDNCNYFQFSQAVCAKSSGKLICLKPWEKSIMLIPL